MRSSPRRVLVVGDHATASLAIVRSLGRKGLEVHLVGYGSSAVTRRSRYVNRLHDLGHPLDRGSNFASRLAELVEAQRFDLVIPSADDALVALMPIRERLNRATAFAAPEPDAFETAFDKAATTRLASRLGIPVPRSTLVVEPRDVEDALKMGGYPLVLKPVRSVIAGVRGRTHVRFAESPDAARQLLPEMLSEGPVLVQAFCPGRGLGVSVLAHEGEVVAAFQHERLHEPPRGGASSYRRSVALDPPLMHQVRTLCSALSWSGPAMFEFKRSHDADSCVLLEINGRFWGSLPLAIFAGVDFPALLFDLMCSGSVPHAPSYRTGMYARLTPREPYWLRANFTAPVGRRDVIRLGVADVLGELGHLLTLRERWDIESLHDPRPGLAAWIETATDLSRSVRRRFRLSRAHHTLRVRARELGSGSETRLTGLFDVPRVVFVCRGNVNRSAVAAARLRQRFAGLANMPDVRSAGFLDRPGRRASGVSRRAAASLGISLETHASVWLGDVPIGPDDLVVLMDRTDLAELLDAYFGQRVRWIPLGALDPEGASEIPDPYGKTELDFRETFVRIIRCVDRLADRFIDPSTRKAELSGPVPRS